MKNSEMKIAKTWQETAESLLARGLMRLPLRILLHAFGEPLVRIDDQVLHPEMQFLLSLRKRNKVPGMSDLPPIQSRDYMRRDARVFGLNLKHIQTRDVMIPVRDQTQIRGRLYQPKKKSSKAPLLVYFHGGGFVLGDIDIYDGPCQFIAHETGVAVFSVDYRLAPEFPFPKGLQDCCDAYEWALSQAADWGFDPKTVVVGGDSAGGNLAAVLCQLRRQEQKLLPALQFLIYPTVDQAGEYVSKNKFADEFLLTKKDIQYFGEHYSPEKDPHNPLVSPLLNSNFSGLPPALVITAAFDPLRDEGEAYAAALKSAGVETTLMRVPGMIHGFLNLIGISPAARKASRKFLRLFKQSINGL